MSNETDTFVDYFKIRWSRKSYWTLPEGACLSCGKNPDTFLIEGGIQIDTPSGKRWAWLMNKKLKNELYVVKTIDGVEYFNTGSVFRLLDEKFTIDKQMRKCLDHMYQAPFGIDYTKFVTRSVYREAGRLIYAKYPNAIMMSVAEVLVDLPKYYNNDDFGHIEKLEAKQIKEFLRQLSDLEQNPKKDDKPVLEVDLSELIQKL